MRRSVRPQLAPPPPRRRLHHLQATPVVWCAESSCTLPAAPPCAVGIRAAVTTFRGATTSSLTGARAHLQARGRLHPWYTYTNINTFCPCTFGPCALSPRAFKHQPWPSALAPSALAPWALVFSWSSTAVAHQHDLTMHKKSHYQPIDAWQHASNIAFATHVVEQGPHAGRGVEISRPETQGWAVTCIWHQRQSLPLYWATTIGGDSPSAPPVHFGGHSRWRAATPTVFVFYFTVIHTNHWQDLTPASTHAQLIHLQKSSESTHSISFKSSDSNSSFPFKSSGSIRASGLWALGPSGSCALPHHGLIPYPIPGFGFILHIFKIQHDPACVLTMCGVQSSGFFIYLFCFSRRVATYLCHVVSLHH